MFWAFCNQHCGGLHKQLCPQVHLYLRIWKHGMVFNLLSTRRYLKQKLRAKVVHFLDSFSKYTGQVFHRTNSSRCKACEKRTFLFQFADVHGLSAICPLLCSGQHRRRTEGWTRRRVLPKWPKKRTTMLCPDQVTDTGAPKEQHLVFLMWSAEEKIISVV